MAKSSGAVVEGIMRALSVNRTEARALAQDAIATLTNNVDPDDSQFLESLLMAARRAGVHPAEQLVIVSQALARKHNYNESQRRTWKCRRAHILRRLGRPEESLTILSAVLADRTGMQDEEVLICLLDLGRSLLDADRPLDAKDVF